MIGLKIKRQSDDAVFTIAGENHDGQAILRLDEFGPLVTEPLAGLREGYATVSEDEELPGAFPAADEQAGWQHSRTPTLAQRSCYSLASTRSESRCG